MSNLTLDENILNRWVGNCVESKDRIDPRQANFLKATLNQDKRDYQEGDNLPPAWHWLYFLEAPALSQLGRDGHAALGNFLPPVNLPKRMWAGGRLKFNCPITVGEELIKTSVVKDIVRKTGRSGELCFVTVNHKYFAGSVLKLEEDHDIVYRGDSDLGSKGSLPTAAPTGGDTSVVIEPTPVLLFRYSALTFNGHRIHYDLDYCKNIENYPGLVVHAPLTATLALELAGNYFNSIDTQSAFSEFSIRMISPLFHDKPFSIYLNRNTNENGKNCELWAANPDGNLAMTATLTLT